MTAAPATAAREVREPLRRSPLRRLDLLGLVVLAALPRLSGLGHVSLWLDEILGTLQTSGTLSETWRALRGDRVHPPLWGLLDWLGQQVTDSESLRRLLPVALGVATVVFLADLVARAAGRRTGLAVAAIAACSPLHVRFSQELRPYSLGLFFLVLALWSTQRALARDRRVDPWLVGFALWGCLASLYLAALAALPVLLLLLGDGSAWANRRRNLLRFGVAGGLAFAAFSPWLGVLSGALAKEHELTASAWSLGAVARRWHFLTVGAADGEAATAATGLTAVLALAGVAAAARRGFGRTVLAAGLAGTVGVELLLLAVDHWTNGRYSIAAWPFVVILLALGCVRGAELAARALSHSSPTLERALVAATVVVVGVAESSGTLRYLAAGRPDWLAVAATVRRVAAADGPIWVSNDWTRVGLGYYLDRLEQAPRGTLSPRVRIATSPLPPVEAGRCGALVVAGFPERTGFDPLFLRSPAQRRFPRTEARLLALSSGAADPWVCLPHDLERSPAERPPRGLAALSEPGPGPSRRLDFERSDSPQLLFGWSFAERDRQGRTFRWALGEWAAARLPARAAGRLRLRAWAFGGERRVTLFRNRIEVARLDLSGKPADYEIGWPANAGPADEAVVHFRFDGWASPDQNPRPLAAGFGAVELVP